LGVAPGLAELRTLGPVARSLAKLGFALRVEPAAHVNDARANSGKRCISGNQGIVAGANSLAPSILDGAVRGIGRLVHRPREVFGEAAACCRRMQNATRL
jgi:hypothetical protein